MQRHPQKTKHYNWVPDFVYGGIDGAVTTFAVVAGVAGANLSTPIIIIMGFANLFADGFSMAVSKYLSDHAEKQRIQKVRERIDRSVHQNPEAKKRDLREILADRGFKGKDLTKAVQVIAENERVWVDTILRHKYHLSEEHIEPTKGAFSTFVAFNIIGVIPLVGYVFNSVFQFNPAALFYGTAAATLFALFVVGAVKGRLIHGKWVLAGLETMMIGGVAATIAYVVGYLLRNID